MKKGAIKTSGIISLILAILMFVIAIFLAGNIFNISAISNIVSSVEILSKVLTILSLIFISVPVQGLSKFLTSVDSEMLAKGAVALLAVFSLYMIFWGIKEISLSKKDDQRFANCKKTCAFMMFIKFMFFAYFVAVIALSMVAEDFKKLSDVAQSLLDVPYIFVIVCGVFALIAFIIWLLPVINIAKVAKAVSSGNYDPNAQYDPNNPNGQQYDPNQMQYGPNGQPYDPNYANNYAPQPTMQANMPPMPGFQPQYNQPQPSVQAQFNPQVQAEEQLRANSILPGQNGVPANITPKGIQDLERLERLRASGAITEENYQVMWQKICSTNLQ